MTKLLLLSHHWKKENYLFDTALIILISCSTLSYAIAFPFLMNTIGPAARLFPLIYILIAALFWGLRGGIATGAVTFLINLVLHHQTGHEFEGGMIGPLAGFITIVMVGRLSDLSRHLACQIEERKFMDEHLRINETKYRLLFDMDSSGLALMENDTTRIIDVNPAALELFGYNRKEMLDLKAIALSKNPETFLLSHQNKQEAPPQQLLRRKDGSTFPGTITTRHFELQKKQYCLISIQDITEKLESEKSQELTQRQHQQTQKLEAIGTLAGGIAHDFNNILGGILGYAQLLQLQDLPWDNKSIGYLEQICNATHRAKHLINQILTFSRQSEGSKQPVMILPILKEALKLLRATIPSRIEIRQHINAPKDTVMADPTQIHQIIINLCTNAYHAIVTGNGFIDITVANTYLDEHFATSHPEIMPGNYLQITVMDTGHGMNRQVLEKIFQPYFTTKKDFGSGLGLSVVHGIVLKHHGCITVESEPGKGSHFHVYFPLAATNSNQEGKSAPTMRGGTEKILLLDDEPLLIEMMRDFLVKMGYRIETRASSIEALELIKVKPDYFDIIITDMAMPHMTGVELQKEILQLNPGLPVIIITGFSENLDPDKAAKLGFKKMLMKPVIFDELVVAIREVLDEMG